MKYAEILIVSVSFLYVCPITRFVILIKFNAPHVTAALKYVLGTMSLCECINNVPCCSVFALKLCGCYNCSKATSLYQMLTHFAGICRTDAMLTIQCYCGCLMPDLGCDSCNTVTALLQNHIRATASSSASSTIMKIKYLTAKKVWLGAVTPRHRRLHALRKFSPL